MPAPAGEGLAPGVGRPGVADASRRARVEEEVVVHHSSLVVVLLENKIYRRAQNGVKHIKQTNALTTYYSTIRAHGSKYSQVGKF